MTINTHMQKEFAASQCTGESLTGIPRRMTSPTPPSSARSRVMDDIREGAWVRTKDGRTVQIWRITVDDGCYCNDLQHHCSSTLTAVWRKEPGA